MEKTSSHIKIATNVGDINAKAHASVHNTAQTGKGRMKPKDDIINNKNSFDQTRVEEAEGLLKNGIFELVNVEDILRKAHVFYSRFIDTVITVNSRVRYKSKLVAKNYGDQDAAMIATKSPRVKRSSQRLVMSIAASLDNMSCYTQDITMLTHSLPLLWRVKFSSVCQLNGSLGK